MQSNNRGVLYVSLGTVAFSLMAIFGKVAYQHGGAVIPVQTFRFLLGGSTLWVLWLLQREKNPISLNPKDRRTLWVMGALGYTGVSGCFFTGLQYIPASLASLLFFTYPIWLTLYGVILDGEKLTWPRASAVLTALAGVALTVGFSQAKLHPLGILLAIASGFIHATYLHFAQPLTKRVPAALLATHLTTAAAVIYLIVAGATGSLFRAMEWQAWISILMMGLVSTVIGLRFLWAGIRLIGASHSALVSTMEPMLTAIWAALFLGEDWGLRQILGGVMILIGVWAIPAYGAWLEKKEQKEGSSR